MGNHNARPPTKGSSKEPKTFDALTEDGNMGNHNARPPTKGSSKEPKTFDALTEDGNMGNHNARAQTKGSSKEPKTFDSLTEDGPISIHRCTNISNNGKVQTYCGLKLTNTRINPATNTVNNFVDVHASNFIAPDGSLQKYWGLKLTNNISQPDKNQAQDPYSIPVHNSGNQGTQGKSNNFDTAMPKKGMTVRKRKQTTHDPPRTSMLNSQEQGSEAGPSNLPTTIHKRCRPIQGTSEKPSATEATKACATSSKKGVSTRKRKRPAEDVTRRSKKESGKRKKSVDSHNQEASANIPKAPGRKKRTRPMSGFTSSGVHVSYLNLGPPTYICQNCNALMWYEERCKSTKLEGYPTFATCCQEGKVLLPKLLDAPEPLKTLLDYDQPGTSKFKDNIRTYNSMFCFTSFGAKIDHSVNEGRNLYTFRISGQNYHRIGSLLPVEGDQPRYAQLYFFDTANETRNRMSAFMPGDSASQKVDEKIVCELTQMLDNHSSLAGAFRMARDWCAENSNNNCELRLLGQRAPTRQYNKPTVSEVAVLVTNDFGENTEPRDVIVSPKSGGLRRISELNQLYMALQYPLLFPYGETGYHEHIRYHRNEGKRKTKRETVTQREFYCYRFHYRSNEGTTLFKGGRLYQQYVVDSYTAVEEERLRYTRTHQPELRAELYNNVCDAVTKGDTHADAVGKRIVLPATFTGSPRYMVQNYQDAMALCRAFGNPDLFITFTANPKWPEIDYMVSLISGQKSHDRSETVTRIFKIKLDLLMEDIMQKKIFGQCKAGIYTIEFQKRGLPHAHILIWFGPETKCETPEDINDIISAEIPLESDDPDLYKAVSEFMLHGPCGPDSPNASCTEEGKCTKHFPRPFYQETTIDAEGYPVYQRRKTGVFVQKGKAKLHNGFVVPYNRYLLLKYQAHINVEWCNRSRAIKYLFKYLNKGPDRATIVIHENVKVDAQTSKENILIIDEIKNYLDCRYLSPCEAVWRMFAFPIHYSYPSVIRLTFHLPEQNMITLRDSDNLRKKVNEEGIEKTMFTEWFVLNKEDERARQYTYAEIPSKYVWQKKFNVWTWREQNKGCIGRIVYCNPAAGPRYYLRILLGVVRGPQSFKDIRTVNGREYPSYKEACNAYGLLNDDKEWTDAINEAKLWATGTQLRDLFVTILLFCDVCSPLEIWNQNWETLSEDILYKKRRQFKFPNLHLSDEQIKNYCLVEIQEALQRNGKSLDDFNDLPKPDETLLTDMDNRLIREELNYNQSQEAHEHEQLFRKLNNDQMTIYEKVISSVHQETGGFYFVYGPGGTGKTFLYKAILSRLRSEGKIALAVASSGIASLLLPGGRTAHSRFVIPLELMESSTCGIKHKTHLAALIQKAKLIIWDEAPMTQKYAFEALDKTLKDILGLNNPENRERLFGGLTVLLGGDFRQILPVIPKGQRQEIVHSCINKSVLWKGCQLYTLSRSMRVNEYTPTGELDRSKQEFNKWVLDIGDGVAEAKTKEGEDEPTWINIPPRFLVPCSASPIEDIINATFPNFDEMKDDEQYLRERAILTPKNSDADEINTHMFNKLKNPARTYKSSDEVCRASTETLEQEEMYPIEFLNSLNFPGMPPHELTLKEGLPVMLLRNVNPSQGLCNGTRMIITDLGKFVIKARIMTGSNLGSTALIPRITLTSTTAKWPFIMKRRQFPVKPCYAMTINKSQGQSLNHVGLYLSNPVFSHGQLYVALSRVTRPEGLQILIVDDNDGQLKHHTRNIVYKEAFNNLYQLN